MGASFLLGIDAGTTVIKSTLFALDGREVAGAAHDSSLLVPRPGWAEADMDVVWQRRGRHGAAGAAPGRGSPESRACRRRHRRRATAPGWWTATAAPCALPSSGPTAAPPPWSRRPIARASAPRSFRSPAPRSIPATRAFTCAGCRRTSPTALARTAAVLRAKDWIFLKLTGVVSTDETDASHTFFSIHPAATTSAFSRCWASSQWRSKIPPAPPPAQHLAPLLPHVAAELGLRPGTPVTAGPFDVAASALGAGAIAPGDACCVMGTAGINQVIADRPVMEPANLGYNMCYVPQANYLRLLPTMTSTPNLAVVRARVLRRRTPGGPKQTGPTSGMNWSAWPVPYRWARMA